MNVMTVGTAVFCKLCIKWQSFNLTRCIY